MASESAAKKKKNEGPVEITVIRAWCKGCGICVEFCPKDVLEMEDGVAVVKRPEDCNRCELCDFRCPDFAITVR